MRGDQLARQWRVIRAIEASSNGLTVAEIATFPSPLESLHAAGFPLYTERVDRVNRWAFIAPFKFKIPPVVSRQVAKFAKKTVSHLPAQNICLVQFLCSQSWRKGPLRPLRLGESFLMRHSFKVIHDELYTVRVRISPGWARWVGEKIWHESQKITKPADGGLQMTLRVAGLDEIKRWVLSLGPECAVMEPERLRKLVQQDLQRNLAQYSKPTLSMKLMKEMQPV